MQKKYLRFVWVVFGTIAAVIAIWWGTRSGTPDPAPPFVLREPDFLGMLGPVANMPAATDARVALLARRHRDLMRIGFDYDIAEDCKIRVDNDTSSRRSGICKSSYLN